MLLRAVLISFIAFLFPISNDLKVQLECFVVQGLVVVGEGKGIEDAFRFADDIIFVRRLPRTSLNTAMASSG